MGQFEKNLIIYRYLHIWWLYETRPVQPYHFQPILISCPSPFKSKYLWLFLQKAIDNTPKALWVVADRPTMDIQYVGTYHL